jgi:hypothetical protein
MEWSGGIYAFLSGHNFRIPQTTSWINIPRTSIISAGEGANKSFFRAIGLCEKQKNSRVANQFVFRLANLENIELGMYPTGNKGNG